MANRLESDRLKEEIIKEIHQSIAVTSELARSCGTEIVEAAALILTCLREGGKLIVFGNGGSAAEAEHLVAEILERVQLSLRCYVPHEGDAVAVTGADAFAVG